MGPDSSTDTEDDMEHEQRDDLPEGVIDADPAGGWESADVADGETAERDDAAEGSASLTEQGGAAEHGDEREQGPGSRSGVGVSAPAGQPASDSHVESAEIQQGLDPDMVTDEQADS